MSNVLVVLKRPSRDFARSFHSCNYGCSSRNKSNNVRICSWLKIEIKFVHGLMLNLLFFGSVQVPLICCSSRNNVKDMFMAED